MQATAKLCKKRARTLRLLAASALGGAYSLIILAQSIPPAVLTLTKLIAAAVMVAVAFSFSRVPSFLYATALFFFMNFVFLGVVYGIAALFRTPYITLQNGTLYLDISAPALLICALLAYLISCLVLRLYNRRLAQGEIFEITVENHSKSVSLSAFSDTGNKLREPFSDYPVIIAESDKVRDLAEENTLRVIPATTVNSAGYLLSFLPERVTIRTPAGMHTVENVYIAMSDDLHDAAFSAVLNPEILSV